MLRQRVHSVSPGGADPSALTRRTSPRRGRPAAALVAALLGLAVAPWAAPAQVAVPDYQVVELPSPAPQAGSNFGERMRTLGDVDGDAVRDVLISSSNFDGPNPAGGVFTNSGRLYLFSGRTRALLRTIEPPTPQANGKFGFWSASLGDVNGDGRGDFATSAAGFTPSGATVPQGQVYIFSSATGALLRTIDPPEDLMAAPGGFGGDFGGNIIGPGDLNGDGIGDLVATASGASAGVGAAFTFSGATGGFLYRVSNPSTQPSSFGFGAAELGDVNADGTPDYQIGAPRYEEGTVPTATARVGRSYVINGRTGAVIHTLTNPEPQFNSRFGQADADGLSLGDITGDGRPDIYVDAFTAGERPPDPAGAPLTGAGTVYLFDGATGNFIRPLRDTAPGMSRTFGASNASAGDLDGDGRPDQLVSSRGGDVGRVTVFGGPNLTAVLKVFQDPANQTGALFGSSIASPGDVNADGLPDYFISSRAQPVNGAAGVGTAYVFLSQAPPPGPGPTPPGPSPAPGPGPSGSSPKAPAKLAVLRAGVNGRVLDVLASMTSLATGTIDATFVNNGTTTRFSVKVPANPRLIKIRRALSSKARRGRTGILTLTYRGNDKVRPDDVRLRAAAGKALLKRTASRIDAAGNLLVSGTISSRARGVVRVRFEYAAGAQGVSTLNLRGTITRGRWSVKQKLPAGAAKTGGQLSIQFTGYQRGRMRGEQTAKAVTGTG